MIVMAVALNMAASPVPISLADDGWLSAGYAVNELRQQRRKGNVLVSAKCRNNPAANNRLSPQYKFVWKPNNGDKEWLYIYVSGNSNWLPGKSPGDEREWRRISGDSFVIARTGRKFYCTLWRHKTEPIAERKKKRFVYTRTAKGIKTGFFKQ